MTVRDYDAVIVLWSGMPGIGLDGESDSRAGIARYLKRNPGLSFVAEIQGEIVGAVLSGHDARRGSIHHLAVAGQYRKLGIGKELTSRCLLALHRQGISKCSIFLFKSNSKGKSFWERNGWELREDLDIFQKMTELKELPDFDSLSHTKYKKA